MESQASERFEGWCIVEEWRPVVGYENLYEVSNQGQVRRVGRAAKNGNGRGGGARIGRIRKQTVTPKGYLAVQLWIDGKPKMHLAHVLVASAFMGQCPDGLEVNHEDGDKLNPAAYNLEYMTHRENNIHAYRTGLKKVSEAFIANNRARRVPRMMVDCACGCGTQIETPDHQARPRRFVNGHNMKRVSA